MDWRNIPSLAALRAFEAAARLGSLTQAAGQLNITQAAVSQHVRSLEAELQTSLMIRQGRRMELTADGAHLSRALSSGFTTIGTAISEIQSQQTDRPLSISLTPSFAENWLMPRLGEFWARHPEIPLSIQPTHKLVDLASDGIDVAIRYGRGPFPDHTNEMLTSATLCAVCTPDVSAAHTDITTAMWFFETHRNEYRVWAKTNKLVNEATPTTSIETNTLALSAARAGLGVCVQLKDVVTRDLDAGALVSVFETDESTLAYHVLTRKSPPSPRLSTFLKWLRSQVELT